MHTDWDEAEEQRAVEAAQRDRREFVRLYDAYADRVYRYLLARTRDVHAAEDLTQETFLKAMEALPRYTWRGVPFGAWLFTIARHAFLNAAAARVHVPIDAVAEPAAPSGTDALERRIDAAGVWRLAAALTDEQYEALTLRFRGELAIAEVAATMKKSEAAVKMLLQRGIKTLAEKL